MEQIHTLPDEELIRYFKQSQDMECLGVLYKRYSHLVLGVCIKVLKDNQLALDLTMQIFEKLATNLQANPIDNFNKWIYAVSKNECVSKIRSRQVEKKYITGWREDLEEQILAEPINENISSDDVGEEDLNLAMNKLTLIQQTCIKLFFMEERTYKEIAQTTGLTEALVKSHLQNGKRNLKRFLS